MSQAATVTGYNINTLPKLHHSLTFFCPVHHHKVPSAASDCSYYNVTNIFCRTASPEKLEYVDIWLLSVVFVQGSTIQVLPPNPFWNFIMMLSLAGLIMALVIQSLVSLAIVLKMQGLVPLHSSMSQCFRNKACCWPVLNYNQEPRLGVRRLYINGVWIIRLQANSSL